MNSSVKSILLLCLFLSSYAHAQNNTLSGKIFSDGEDLPYVNIYFKNNKLGTASDNHGFYNIKNIPNGTYTIIISSVGYKTKSINISFKNTQIIRDFSLESDNSLEEVVISGTLRPVSKSNSPVPVDVYSETFFRKNPTPAPRL